MLLLHTKPMPFIQAPALAALLPKLHLYRHTPHAILFAGPTYGGLSLPELYVDQSVGQLQYLIGHVKLQDKISQQIFCQLTYLQLIVGSTTPIFQLPFPVYKKWIDRNWLVSIWHQLHLTNSTTYNSTRSDNMIKP
jgi:hypothetical protein